MTRRPPNSIVMMQHNFLMFVMWGFRVLNPGQKLEVDPYLEAVVEFVEDVIQGRGARKIINCPPRTMKSLIVSVLLPAFVLGQRPSKKITVASYNAELATELHGLFRQIVGHRVYRRAFPKMRNDGRTDTKMHYKTDTGGFRRAVTVEGATTGLGGDIFIIDDPLKAQDAASQAERDKVGNWFGQTLSNRPNQPTNTVFLLVAQRLHEDDLSGRLIELGGFEVLKLPAIFSEEVTVKLTRGHTHTYGAGDLLAPGRLTHAVLDERRRDGGSRNFEAQYLQEPVPAVGNVFQASWSRRYISPPAYGQIVQSWDIAAKTGETHDYSACTIWRVSENQAYLLDAFRVRLVFPKLLRRIHETAQLYNAERILIEDAGSGTAAIQQLLSSTNLNVIGIKPTLAKEVRAEAATAPIEAGRILFPKDMPEGFEQEMLAFPNGRHDDFVDSMVQFVLYFERNEIVPTPQIHLSNNPNPWSSLTGNFRSDMY